MATAASLAEVGGVTLRDLYETDDDNYLKFVTAVISRTIDVREYQAREAKRR